MIGCAFDSEWWLSIAWLLSPFALVVRLLPKRAAVVTVDPHGTISMIVVHRAAWCVHRNKVVIDAEPVTLRVTVG